MANDSLIELLETQKVNKQKLFCLGIDRAIAIIRKHDAAAACKHTQMDNVMHSDDRDVFLCRNCMQSFEVEAKQ